MPNDIPAPPSAVLDRDNLPAAMEAAGTGRSTRTVVLIVSILVLLLGTGVFVALWQVDSIQPADLVFSAILGFVGLIGIAAGIGMTPAKQKAAADARAATLAKRQQEKAAIAEFAQTLAPLHQPVVTFPLVGINVLIFALMLLSGLGVTDPDARVMLHWGANYAPLTEHGQWWRLITNVFLHFTILHVAMNMLILISIGRLVERMLGRTGMLACYLITGWAGSLASLVWHAAHPVVSAGASGAIFGLFGVAIGFILPRARLIPRPAFVALNKSFFQFVAINLVYSLNGGIDMSAHVGGLCAGVVCGFIAGIPGHGGGTGRIIRNAILVLLGLLLVVLTPSIAHYCASGSAMAQSQR